MRADGTHVRQVTNPSSAYEDYGPQWSPDGTRIAFKRITGNRCDCDHAGLAALFTVRLDGTDLRRLTPWRLDGGDEPDYSPDGRWILFLSHQCLCRPTNLWEVHPNGRGLHSITENPAGTYLWLSSSFSPDGKMIVSARKPFPEGDADINVMNNDGSGLEMAAQRRAYDSSPDWGPVP
jgi:TolB protein